MIKTANKARFITNPNDTSLMSLEKRAAKTSTSDFYAGSTLYSQNESNSMPANRKMSLSKRLVLLQEKIHLRKIKKI